ncbi:MAG: ribose-phosphate pyrophosphokinase [Deltaproteobacteria bacterium]|nr:ribose-phosphate pyrophosphokinase [Deltaproteobacteria bacterium]
MATYGMKIFAGNSNKALAEQICEDLEMHLGRALVTRFSDGEVRVEIGENVRGADVFLVQSGASPVNDHLMELLVMIDALKRASAWRITAVIPYYSYARQDRKNKPRVPITARLVADLITRAGAHRILTMDLHAGQIQGFFDIPVDNLYASPILLPYIRENFNNGLVIVSPDAGGVPRARAYARRLKAGLALIDKRRSDVNQAEALNIIGEVEGKTAIVLDDMVDTAGTLIEATKSLLDKGARDVHACVTHAVLSGPAMERIEGSPLNSLVVTDTLPLRPEAAKCSKIVCLPSCHLFSAAIRNIHNEDSISTLFEILH